MGKDRSIFIRHETPMEANGGVFITKMTKPEAT